jgi:hypothetical protein
MTSCKSSDVFIARAKIPRRLTTSKRLLFPVYFISVLLKLIHFHVCVFEEEINKNKTKTTTTIFIYFVLYCMDIDICPLLEGDRIIPLYTSFNLNQWDEWFRKVWEIWLLKLPYGGNSHCLLVVCRLGNLARAMKKSEDLHDVI